jgi:hypothetical protein
VSQLADLQAHIAVEYMTIEAEIAGGITQADEAWKQLPTAFRTSAAARCVSRFVHRHDLDTPRSENPREIQSPRRLVSSSPCQYLLVSAPSLSPLPSTDPYTC